MVTMMASSAVAAILSSGAFLDTQRGIGSASRGFAGSPVDSIIRHPTPLHSVLDEDGTEGLGNDTIMNVIFVLL